MPATERPMPPHRPTDEHATATALLERYGGQAADQGSPVWLEWRNGSSGLETLEITGREGLLGQKVAPDWEGAAVVGTGRLRLLDEGHEPPAQLKPGLAGGLAMACAVRRGGQVGWRMRLPDGDFYDRVPEEGFMLDILRRSLGLPTPRPPASTAALELAAWFGAIIGRSMDEGRKLDWCETIRLHPAVSDGTPAENRERVLRARSSLASDDEWDLMRRLVAAGLTTATTPPPHLADWMDAGMFARWVLDGLPPLDDLLSMVRPHLEPEARRQTRHLARVLDDRVAAI